MTDPSGMPTFPPDRQAVRPTPVAAPATKIRPPTADPHQVPRLSVCDRIRQAVTARLVLVRAPAGFGKTTSMLQARAALEADGIDTAWLTLDRADNDVPRFLACLADAVADIAADGFGAAPADPMAALARHPSPFALFLDDFEVIQEPAVLGLVREMLDHLPRRGQVVIGSRGLPDLGLGRLRARGQLVEVDTEHLRFTLDETTEFFQRRGGTPPAPQALALLNRKTEGWVAALWLASLALERRGSGSDFIERFSGSNRAVADYLAEDVLAQQTPEVRGFLLRTSILRDLNASLCQALNPRADSVRILAQLEAANVFLIPLAADAQGTGGPAWRYHSLFADFLRAQLQREMPDEFARLHLSASGWYEAEQRPVPAIEHAIDGGDYPHALSLLVQHAEAFLAQGRMRLLARWFSVVPEAALRAHPLLEVVAVWSACFTQGPWEAMARLDRSGAGRSDDAVVRAHENALRPLLLAMMDRYEDAYAAGRQNLARLPTSRPFADSVLTNAMASVVSVMGEPHEAHRLLDAARAGRGATPFVRMYTESMEGLLDLQEGRLRQATARFRMVLSQAQTATYEHHNGNAWAGVLYASAVYEENRLDAADHLLNIYLPLARDVGLPDHMILSHVLRSRIAFHRGDIDSAFLVLTELEYLGHHRQLPRVVCSAKLERARMLMLQGNGQAAREELDRADDPAVWDRVARQRLPAHDTDDMALGRLRWQLMFSDARAASSAIAREIARDEASGRRRRVMKLQVLQALALQRSGDPDAASRTLAPVLHAASVEGAMRFVLDEGEPAAALLHRHRQRASDATDPLSDDSLQRLVDAAGPLSAAEPEAAPTPSVDPLQEPLTRKEIRVLQLLAEGYSNSAMAEKLFVSDSTVRTHLRNINMKLNAKSRTQAVAIARRLAVIR